MVGVAGEVVHRGRSALAVRWKPRCGKCLSCRRLAVGYQCSAAGFLQSVHPWVRCPMGAATAGNPTFLDCVDANSWSRFFDFLALSWRAGAGDAVRSLGGIDPI